MDELLDLAIADPGAATSRAEAILARSTDPAERSYAYQVLGIVLRDEGDVIAALKALRLGLRAARSTGDPDRTRDVRATYGATLVVGGRSAAGLRELQVAAQGATGELGGKVLVRLAGVLALLGRYEESLPVLAAALDELVAAQNRVWEARTRTWAGHCHLALGQVKAARQQVELAEGIFREEGASVEHLLAVHNMAHVAAIRGDLATCLQLCAHAVDTARSIGSKPHFDAAALYATASLQAGMPSQAVDHLREFALRVSLAPHETAELQFALAVALLANDDVSAALVAARNARNAYRRQGRGWFELRARLVAVRAWAAGGQERSGGLAREATRVSAALHHERADEAPIALSLAGSLLGGDQRLEAWTQAASYRNHPNALVRAGAWNAQALAREETRDRGGVLRAAASGLDAIDEHRQLIGSSELRALATTHGRDLTTIALRHAATDPRTLLKWSERTRATALAQPPATSDAATIPASLAAFRANGRRLARARQDGEPTEDLEKERLRLERAVRAEHHTLSAESVERQRPVSADEVVTSVGDGCLVELVDVDGTLHVLVVHGGKVRRRIAGSTAEVGELLGPAAMLLRRTSRGRPADLTALGQRLQEAILGDAVRLIPEGPVVIAPTARLHGLPWALLPALHDRPFSVVPSAGQLLRARATARPEDPRTVLVCGPGLATGGAEVPVLAARHPDAVLLDGGHATLEAVLIQLDGADLVHLAAHGHFRSDSPLFSALDLADGPLTVHDLERLQRAPYRVVLSACESGVLAPVGSEELLGLAAALFSLGTAGLVSSVAEVNDVATADLMVDLHAALAAGSDPATALHEVRRAAVPGSVEAATAAAFVALGV